MHPLTRTVTKSTTAPCADRQQDAAEFFDAYLEVLVEELVALHGSINTGKLNPESSLKSEELEEGTQPVVRRREVYTVRQFLFLQPSLAILTFV